MSVQPLADKDRIVSWDLLRGIAVLGVLLANMPLMSFSGAWAFSPAWVSVEEPANIFAFAFVRVFADVKFITLFSLLFGAGLAIMSERAIADGDRPFAGLYLRRLAVLFVIGFVHGIVFWSGDILAHYAFMGGVALLFRRVSIPWLLVISGVLFALSVGIFVLGGWGQHYEQTVELNTAAPKLLAMGAAFGEGGVGDQIVYRAQSFPVLFLIFLFFIGPRTLALFLLGMAIVKSGLFSRASQERGRWKRFAIVGLVLGLPLQAIWLSLALKGGHGLPLDQELSDRLIISLLSAIAAIPMSAAYASMAVLWATRLGSDFLRERLVAVGRMALTNYLSHSLITWAIFQLGGQWDQWTRIELLGLCFVIFAFQLEFSLRWMAAYRYGPLEWAWRSLTYNQRQSMSRSASRGRLSQES